MNDPYIDAPGTTPGRRELAHDRRHARRARRLRIGAAAVAGALALGAAGATVQNEDLRAGLAGLTSPLVASDPAADNPSSPAAESSSDPQAAADPEQEARAQEQDAAAAAEQAEQAEKAEKAEKAEAAQAAEASAAEEARAADEAAAAEALAGHAAQEEAAARAAEQAAAEAAALAAAPVLVDDPAAAKAYAASALAARGWADAEMTCLNTLWEKESNWTTSATNASSGAYGIVQSLPAEKMASAGGDYLTNYKTQINWGLDYIASRYGTPCGALNFHYANNWY